MEVALEHREGVLEEGQVLQSVTIARNLVQNFVATRADQVPLSAGEEAEQISNGWK